MTAAKPSERDLEQARIALLHPVGSAWPCECYACDFDATMLRAATALAEREREATRAVWRDTFVRLATLYDIDLARLRTAPASSGAVTFDVRLEAFAGELARAAVEALKT